ncbi:RHOMBOID-like protein 5 isoform X3 [Rosa chinensis]|uniref:RHOMBOID-like protein 5 isoform X3 n=1 Tax=Rosa chinensis TaxID=74649 RepID=UPI001AD8FBAB|nr:RHOMBOID-like protein 5 isoform X3 [Rosa chinensis]
MGKGMPYSDVEKGPERGQEKRRHRSRPPPPQICPPPEKPWFPWLVPVIFSANLIMFIITMYINDCPSQENHPRCVLPFLKRFSFQPFKENILLGPSALTLQKLGALERNLVVDDGEGWRLLSCMWLHAGVVHLVVNMLSLLFIGIRLEQEFGFIRIGPLYVLSGLAGSLASTNHGKESSVSVGASGALFGLLGAMLSELFTNWTIYTKKIYICLWQAIWCSTNEKSALISRNRDILESSPASSSRIAGHRERHMYLYGMTPIEMKYLKHTCGFACKTRTKYVILSWKERLLAKTAGIF